MEIKEYQVYTHEESCKLLKISPSTMIRLIKRALINAAKVGKQYRILGRELLRVVSPVPELESNGTKYLSLATREP